MEKNGEIIMNSEVVSAFMKVVRKHSPNCFINSELEMIIEPKWNIFFRLEDVESELDLKCKVVEWLSRPSTTGSSVYWQNRIRKIFNEYLGTEFNRFEVGEVYAELGNAIHHDKTIKFIKSGYDLEVLR